MRAVSAVKKDLKPFDPTTRAVYIVKLNYPEYSTSGPEYPDSPEYPGPGPETPAPPETEQKEVQKNLI